MPLPTAISSFPHRLCPQPLRHARTRARRRGAVPRVLDPREPPNPEAPPAPRSCLCCGSWSRRSLLLGAPLITSAAPSRLPDALAADASSDAMVGVGAANRRPRREWYDALYAKAMHGCMGRYESAIDGYKSEVFKILSSEDSEILEIGIGTGPNLKYYAGARGAHVYGVDPNRQMEKYARDAAVSSGLPLENFSFLEGYAEALPVKDSCMDAVIGTLVLCSVENVDATLREVKRVLKPGGVYLFIEHVAARDGSFIRYIQTVLDPLQQLVADGCHLTRQTGRSISEAGFSDAQINMSSIPHLFIFGPHVYGFARK